jgi:hypothetical protein
MPNLNNFYILTHKTMNKNIIIIVLTITTMLGFILAYSQYTRADHLEVEAQRQRKIAEHNMEIAIEAQVEAERLQEYAKQEAMRARIAEDRAIAAKERAEKSEAK